MTGELKQPEIKMLISVAGYTLCETQHSLYSGYAGAGRSGVQIPVGARYFALIQKRLDWVWGSTRPPVQWVPGIYPGDKAPRS
jgi:hypothetical protein